MRWPVTWLMPSTITVSTLCERLLRSFILVSATARFRAPISITRITSSLLLTSTCTSRDWVYVLKHLNARSVLTL